MFRQRLNSETTPKNIFCLCLEYSLGEYIQKSEVKLANLTVWGKVCVVEGMLVIHYNPPDYQ